MKLCDDGVKFIFDSPKLFCIPYNYIYNALKQKVCTTIPCPSNTSINNIYFRRPTLTFEGHTMYEVVELKADEDVFQMFQCKSSSILNIIIELYVTFTRFVEEILSLLTPNTPSSSSNFTNNYLLWWTFERRSDHRE